MNLRGSMRGSTWERLEEEVRRKIFNYALIISEKKRLAQLKIWEGKVETVCIKAAEEMLPN